MTRVMYDAVNVTRIPTNAVMVAGYVNGLYETFPGLVARFPKALHVSIAVNVGADAQVLDVEQGDATPADAPGWAVRQRRRGQEPTVYCNASTWPAVRAAFAVAGVPAPSYWIADYDGIPTVPAGAVAKQYAGGMTAPYDVSVVGPYWPGVDPAPEEDMTPQEMLAALDAAGTATVAGTPVPGTAFIDAVAKRAVQMIEADQAKTKGAV